MRGKNHVFRGMSKTVRGTWLSTRFIAHEENVRSYWFARCCYGNKWYHHVTLCIWSHLAARHHLCMNVCCLDCNKSLACCLENESTSPNIFYFSMSVMQEQRSMDRCVWFRGKSYRKKICNHYYNWSQICVDNNTFLDTLSVLLT